MSGEGEGAAGRQITHNDVRTVPSYDGRGCSLAAALFLRSLANDYQARLRDDCMATCARLGFSLDVFSADNGPDRQLEQIQQFLKTTRRGSTAILVSPVRERELLTAAYDGIRKGLAWVVLNRSSGYLRELREQFPGSLVFSVTPDQHEIGTIQGRQFKLMLPEGGELFYLGGSRQIGCSGERIRTSGSRVFAHG